MGEGLPEPARQAMIRSTTQHTALRPSPRIPPEGLPRHSMWAGNGPTITRKGDTTMAETAQTEVQRLVDRALKLGDAELAADIRAFAKQREFGLVFEHNRPERMRLYGKPISIGDTVQIMAPRGQKETDENKVCWKVQSMADGVAILTDVNTHRNEKSEAAVDDLVAVADYDEPIYPGLRETGRIEYGGDKPYQVVINGENYHALESLLFCYAGKVDCIYIDPPYNTGAKDWKYNNDYVDSSDEYRHSKWLAMMERRLKLAKKLLNPRDSVLICAIDEREVNRLGLLLEEVFPADRIQMISTLTNPKGVSVKGGFKRADEYLFFVMLGDACPTPLPLGNEWKASANAAVSNESGAQTMSWTSMMRRGSNSHREDRPQLFYPIYANPSSKTIEYIGEPVDEGSHVAPKIEGLIPILPIRKNGREGRWQIGAEELRRRIEQGRVRLGRETSYGYVVNYLPDGEWDRITRGEFEIIGHETDGSVITKSVGREGSSIAPTQWKLASHNSSEYGTAYIAALIPGRAFSFPKSLYAVEDSIRFFVANKPNAFVLDFFSGSGTTAHAVMRLNHQDGGRRRCICVTNNEVSEAEEKQLTKQGYRHGDPEWERLGICEYVTKPRIEAAITGRTPEGDPIKGDYKFTDVFPMSDGFKENAVFYDLTYENPRMVEFGESFSAIAPLLWLRAGAEGNIIEREQMDYSIADTYAVLFTYAYANEFVETVVVKPNIKCVYVVTDDEARFANVAARLPGRDVVRLYESYLQSFKIAAEGAVN